MCSHPPTARHRGRCSLDVIEDVEFIATSDGVARDSTKVGYQRSYRLQLADRLGMTQSALERSLLRAASQVVVR